ncbi:hypothetical protein HS041_23325 [Planomonospora sp. ID67723]|uniref:hypothetical protein n=1 Tax=Planomonospora sp. ID67723 TaxID=2738134 RepID=UPI0018C42666|nr:hypothetical protein [Planomonospora sp. ID67723]MBG0830696.1 hypothetical protein [Planomonospora sp. ID67723]
MIKRIAVGVLSTVVGGSLLLTAGAGTASATRAQLAVKIANVNPNPVVVKGGEETPVTVEVRTTEAVRVELRLRPDSDRARTLAAEEPKVIHEGDLWRFVASFDKSDYEGRWLAIADAFDKDGKKVTDQVNFSVKHEAGQAETRLTRFSADPGTVRKGRWIHFSGRLQVREDWRWQGLDDEEVEIYYRSSGSSAWKYVTSGDTDHRGRFYAKSRAFRSGEFRAVFEGDDELGESASRSDWVRVKRWSHRGR